MKPRHFLVLAGMVVFSSVGDILLSRGMKGIGAVSLSHGLQLIPAVFNPWVSLGILFLLGYFVSYASALSWADLTFVVPATSFGYVLIALLSQLFLGENVTVVRWLGILLVSAGVGVVARSPHLTKHHEEAPAKVFSPALSAASEGNS